MRSTPKYLSVMQDLKEQIENGSLKSGDQLKSEKEYAQIYDSSTITIRKALEILVGEKLVYRVRGKGSYVCDPSEEGGDNPLLALVFSIEDYHDASFMQIIMGIQRTLAQMNCSLIVEWNHRMIESETASIRGLIQRKVDGVFLYPYDPNASIANYRLLEQAGIPYVLLDHKSNAFPTHFVSCDNQMGSTLATTYMLSKNHRKLRYVTYDFSFSSEQERYEAFFSTMKKHGLCRCDESLMLSFSEIDFAALAAEIRGGGITGLVCANDKLAVRCIRQLMEQGLGIPEDVSIIGFDDWERNSTSPVPLTTIRQSFVNLGVYAAQLMRILRETPDMEKCAMRISVDLVERQSVRALPGECRSI